MVPMTETIDPMAGSPRLMPLTEFMVLGRRIYTHSVHSTVLKLLPLMRYKNSLSRTKNCVHLSPCDWLMVRNGAALGPSFRLSP